MTMEFDSSIMDGALYLSSDWLEIQYEEALLDDVIALEGSSVEATFYTTTDVDVILHYFTMNIVAYTAP